MAFIVPKHEGALATPLNWNAEAVAVSPLLLGNISIHPVPTQFSLGMDKRFLRIYRANSLSQLLTVKLATR